MEPHFADNCRSLTEKLHALREPDDLCFALLAGTAVSDFADHTDENIRAVDADRGTVPDKPSPDTSARL